ncbi:prepilin-type N-terminal cleavage/methylation domain-containing protein [Uliginosibacterium sp. 31-16]|uniref:pilus assembly FimT family protein n=1 Tax=Uliginosibacterium sp. 31-16 TaxID=3068315 RepID=UPI00273E9C0D|nr:prepilin-type N-terminal cleavage/methylation domain-containing protein [Uliginosibacterium sp. 31-16]MDP5240738.1 prepilin-type N-terminal cleavage/methylation domain-containing protein [Uliginosibacterium sp. 31-16]
MINTQARPAPSFAVVGSCERGFTLVELMVAVSVMAVLLVIAIPGFTEQIRSGRTQMASDGLKRAVSRAKDVARDTGRRTILTVNGTPVGVAGCDDAAWAITQGSEIISCLTKADFTKRYEGTSIGSGATAVMTFLPSGIGSGIVNGSGDSISSVSYEMKSGSTFKTVKIYAGGVVDVI